MRALGASGARAYLLIEQALRECLWLRVAVELLQHVVILGRDVPVLQLQQRRVCGQIQTAPLGGHRRLLVPQALQVAIGELGLWHTTVGQGTPPRA